MEEKMDNLEERMARIETKMDDLLALKLKGAGALWLITIIFGTSATAAGIELIRWLIGK